MKTILHKSDTRGSADHGWLKSHHSFSFAGFHDPQKMGFGLLRVLNDDVVQGGMGFATHPHSNMEIISIPLSGSLRHRDDMGNSSIIQSNEVQIMSAGTGVRHSEFNNSRTQPVNFLQLWIFPAQQDLTPRYEQKYFNPDDGLNKWQEVVSPEAGNSVWINQHAFINRITLEKGNSLTYSFHGLGQGAYLFMINGSAQVGDYHIVTKDALGIWDTKEFVLEASDSSELLVIEVPMN
jgi:redox-sensitive bicupin YhaK (pirin superfamily)